MSHIYVLMAGTHPTNARTTLAAAQQAAEDTESNYRDEPVDYRWDEESGIHDTRVWQLRVKGPSGRWSKAYRAVHEVPTA